MTCQVWLPGFVAMLSDERGGGGYTTNCQRQAGPVRSQARHYRRWEWRGHTQAISWSSHITVASLLSADCSWQSQQSAQLSPTSDSPLCTLNYVYFTSTRTFKMQTTTKRKAESYNNQLYHSSKTIPFDQQLFPSRRHFCPHLIARLNPYYSLIFIWFSFSLFKLKQNDKPKIFCFS